MADASLISGGLALEVTHEATCGLSRLDAHIMGGARPPKGFPRFGPENTCLDEGDETRGVPALLPAHPDHLGLP